MVSSYYGKGLLLFALCHKYSCHKYKGPLRASKLKELKANLNQQLMCFVRIQKGSVATVTASNELSQMIAKSGKPYSDGDFNKKCTLKTAETVCPDKAQLFKDISLTRNTVAERIDEMSDDLKHQMKTMSSKFEHFSLAIDETCGITGIAQLAVSIRVCDRDVNIYKELLELIPMYDTTTSDHIFDQISNFYRITDLIWVNSYAYLLTVLLIWLVSIMALVQNYEKR